MSEGKILFTVCHVNRFCEWFSRKVSGGHGGQKLEHKTSRCSSVIMVNLALVMCIMKITSSRHRGDYSP